MSELRELYQEVILDHNRSPRNFGRLDEPDRQAEGYNPLCGDTCHVSLVMDGDAVKDVRFDGNGCAISKASASLMTSAIKGMPLDEVKRLIEIFKGLVTEGSVSEADEALLGKLAVLAGVSEFPSRVKCATLAWHTLKAALDRVQDPVSTE